MSDSARGSLPERMTVAAVGDCVVARRISKSRDEAFLALARLLREADCTWGNCETVFVDPRDAYPVNKQGDTHLVCEPWGAEELAWMGIDCLGTANNHIMDWGPAGLFSTLESLERAGLSHAGTGRDLAEAAQPGYHDGPAGRVAQVNCTSSLRPSFAAGASHPYVPGRPGVNPLNRQYVLRVDPDLFERLRALQERSCELSGYADYPEVIAGFLSQFKEDEGFFGDTMFQLGDELDQIHVVNTDDVKRITASIRVARNNARLVLATMHTHESRLRAEVSSPFIPEFARATIDAGADMFFAAGAHVLRGVEVYQGKPIFYGLSNFFFHYECVRYIPAEEYTRVGLSADTLDFSLHAAKARFDRHEGSWRSIVPVVTVEGGGSEARVVSVEIHPVVLGFEEASWNRGTPTLARGEQAQVVLDDVVRLSEPYGTSIKVRDGVGHVELS